MIRWSSSGLDLATAEARPDPIVALAADHRELWLFGSQSIEVAFNSGNPDFPIERISGAVIEQGCVAPWSVAALDNTLYWLHGSTRGAGAVLRARGYQPEEITPARRRVGLAPVRPPWRMRAPSPIARVAMRTMC